MIFSHYGTRAAPAAAAATIENVSDVEFKIHSMIFSSSVVSVSVTAVKWTSVAAADSKTRWDAGQILVSYYAIIYYVLELA